MASSCFAAAQSLVQISNLFGMKTLWLSNAIHSHYIHLFHRCSCFFCSMIYPKLWEKSCFVGLLPLCSATRVPSAAPGGDGVPQPPQGPRLALLLALPGQFNFSNLQHQGCQQFKGTALSEHKVFKLRWFFTPW